MSGVTTSRRAALTVALCAVIFLAGGVVGGGITILRMGRQTREALERPDLLPRRIAHRLAARLDLSEDQARRVEAIVARRYERIRRARESLLHDITPEIDGIEREIRPLLQPEQERRFAERFRRFRDDWLPPQLVKP